MLASLWLMHRKRGHEQLVVAHRKRTSPTGTASAPFMRKELYPTQWTVALANKCDSPLGL